jgi:hypothetical protein
MIKRILLNFQPPDLVLVLSIAKRERGDPLNSFFSHDSLPHYPDFETIILTELNPLLAGEFRQSINEITLGFNGRVPWVGTQ